MFERAIEIDPTYARAYAGIADCCSFLYTYWHASTNTLEQADAASRKALHERLRYALSRYADPWQERARGADRAEFEAIPA